MSEKSSIDIDNELDFQIAKMLIEKNKKYHIVKNLF